MVTGESGLAYQHTRLAVRLLRADLHCHPLGAGTNTGGDELGRLCRTSQIDIADQPQAPVIFVGILVFALVYYFAGGHKTYDGPVVLVKRPKRLETEWLTMVASKAPVL